MNDDTDSQRMLCSLSGSARRMCLKFFSILHSRSPACFHTQLALTVINIERNFIKSPFDMPQDQRAKWADHAQRQLPRLPRLLPLAVWTQGMT